MTIRVIQWGAGNNGYALIRAIADHQSLELVGCRVYSDSKHGRDAGKLAGIAPLGISATTDRQSLIDVDADVVIPERAPWGLLVRTPNIGGAENEA